MRKCPTETVSKWGGQISPAGVQKWEKAKPGENPPVDFSLIEGNPPSAKRVPQKQTGHVESKPQKQIGHVESAESKPQKQTGHVESKAQARNQSSEKSRLGPPSRLLSIGECISDTGAN